MHFAFLWCVPILLSLTLARCDTFGDEDQMVDYVRGHQDYPNQLAARSFQPRYVPQAEEVQDEEEQEEEEFAFRNVDQDDYDEPRGGIRSRTGMHGLGALLPKLPHSHNAPSWWKTLNWKPIVTVVSTVFPPLGALLKFVLGFLIPGVQLN